MRIGSGVLKLTIRSMFLITDLIFLESKFLVKKLFGSGKKDERDDELESGISEGYTKFKRFFETLNAGYLMWRQFRREAIEPILQIEEYDDDDDDDDERDDENHNQESSGSEVVATLKVPGSSYLLYCSVFDYLRHGSIKFKLPRSKESRYHRDLLRTIELNTDPDCGDEEEDCRVSKRSMSRFSIKFDDTSSPFNVSVEPHRNRILVLISSDGEKQENLRVCEARKVYQLSKKLGLEDLKRKMVIMR
ncbi:hypothetical protein BY996DRAFT_3892175 [Phakopsora pachyrhizi]|nr:hypothetical protein BY996DRAFT_3892175 [Phakopsora pachyrhizi]